MASPLVGAIQLMIGATPNLKQLVKDAEDTTSVAAQQVKQVRAVASTVNAISLVGIGAISVGLIKATQSAMAFEESFAGIEKTVDATEAQFDRLAKQIIQLSTTIPVSADELNRIGELGGQLGIAVQNLPNFIQTVSTLATTTNLTVDNAALGLARLDAIAQTNGETFENVASTIVDLGNNFAATESEIMTTVLRIQQAAAQVGATTQDALAFAAALQAIGVPAQAGGTAVARVFQSIQSAVISGNEQLQIFGNIAEASGRTTAEAFASFFKDDPASAALAFIEGLGEINAAGGDVISMLDDLDLKQRRTMLAILGLAEAEGLLSDALITARTSFDENTAATEEAIKRYRTTASQIEILRNTFNELGVQIGNEVLPVFRGLVDSLQELVIGISISENAFTTIKTALGVFTVALVTANRALLALRTTAVGIGKFLGPVGITLTALASIIGIFGVNSARSKGEFEQLVRSLETFGDDGEVTKKTLNGLIETTEEFASELDKLNEDDRFNTKNRIINQILGDPKDTQAYIAELEKELKALTNIEGKAGRGTGGLTQTDRDRVNMINTELEIINAILPAIDEQNRRREESIRLEAMEALEIENLAEKGSILRSFQDKAIEGYIAQQKAQKDVTDSTQELTDETLNLTTVFDAIEDSLKDATDSLFTSLDPLPDLVVRTADEMVQAFRERFLLAEIFKSQIKTLQDEGFDDLAFLATQLGPEFAASLQNLLNDPAALREIETGLENQNLKTIEQFKINSQKVASVAGDEFLVAGKDSGQKYAQGLIEGFKGEVPNTQEAYADNLEKVAQIADIIFNTKSPSKRTEQVGRFIMLGFVKGIKAEYPTLEREFKGTMIDIADLIEESAEDAVRNISGAFSSQFGLFSSSRRLQRDEKSLNDLYKERDQLLKGNTAQQIKSITEAQDKVDFLRLAYEEGTAPLYELQIAEEELRKAQGENAEELANINEEILDTQAAIAQGKLSVGLDAFGLLQAGPEAVDLFEEIGRVLGIDETLIKTVTDATGVLAQTLGRDVGGAIDVIAADIFAFKQQVEQEEITIRVNADTSGFTQSVSDFGKSFIPSRRPSDIDQQNVNRIIAAGGMAGGGRIKMYANGGILNSGYGIVGEYGPEMIRAIPGGGVDVTPMGNFGSSNINVENINVNVTGVPSDPMQARKAAIQIRKELSKLDREGLIGTGIRGR